MKKFTLLTVCAALLTPFFLVGCTDSAGPQDTSAATTVTTDTTREETTLTENLTDPVTEPVTEPATDPVTEETTSPETEPETTPEAETQPPVQVEETVTRSLSTVHIVAGDSPSEQYAAAELTDYLTRMGLTVTEDAYTVTLSIDPTMPDDSYRMVVRRKNKDGTTITGGKRGVIYGVYRFLEEFGGCRFFTPDLEVVPEGKFTITTGVIAYTPVFENRHTDWYSVKTEADWMVKNGLNCSIYTDISEEMGSKWSYGSQFVHNICAVTNTDPNAQPCLTDPANLEYAIQYVRNRLASEPGVNIITVSQMDNQNYCRCANCAAVDAEEGSPAGTLLRFVNAIARDIAEDYPDVVIDTLAYLYTRKAPAVTVPEPNVCIRLCPIECCYVHALDDPSCPENVAFCQDLMDWSEICNRIYIWDYTTNFCHYIPTFNNLQVMRKNMQFFAEHNVKGMFPQGNSASVSGEFGELRAYLLAKLMVNPLMTEEEYDRHMNEFLEAYYGEGWSYIRSYIDLTTVLSESDCQDCMNHPKHSVVLKLYPLVEDNLNEWWDKAEELAGDRVEYVQRSRLQWRYIRLMIHPDKETAAKFIADVKAAGVTWGDGTTSDVPARADLNIGPEYWFVMGYWLPEN